MSIEVINDWYEKHGKKADRGFVKQLSSFTTTNGAILLHWAWTEEAYKTVYGYFLDKENTLYCRHFYQSVSEAAWRAGTGFRAGGAWVKGAEQHESNRGGYIFEGMVCSDLELKLEKFHSNQQKEFDNQIDYEYDQAMNEYLTGENNGIQPVKSTKKNDGGNWSNDLMKDKRSSLYLFLVNRDDNAVGRGAYRPLSGIILEYVLERHWERFLPTHLFDEDYQKTSAVLAQQTFKGAKQVRAGREVINIPKKIQKNNALWELLNQSLNSPSGNTRNCTHEALKEDYKITTYQLIREGKQLYIEIGQSENKQRTYKFENEVIYINSPVCWVRSIRSTDHTTSFGNYITYPEDLCFLVQKPLDYIKQTSAYLASRNDVKTVIKGKDLAFDGRQDNTNIIPKSEKDTYMLLALFNEKYCPLIQEYKNKNNLISFNKKSSIMQIDYNNFCKRSYAMIGMAKLACQQYLELADDAKAKGSGQNGINRVKAFQRLLIDLEVNNRQDQFCNHVIQLFKENKVNNARPGWSMFDSIRAKNNSFFTIFCQNVLCVPANSFDIENPNHDVAKKDDQINLLIKINSIKPNIILSLYIQTIKLGITNVMTLDSTISEQLLSICKNWKHS